LDGCGKSPAGFEVFDGKTETLGLIETSLDMSDPETELCNTKQPV